MCLFPCVCVCVLIKFPFSFCEFVFILLFHFSILFILSVLFVFFTPEKECQMEEMVEAMVFWELFLQEA